MMKIGIHLDKNNLHHAYLIEGNKEEIIPEIFDFLNILQIKTTDNPDFNQINLDSFKINDARNLKSQSIEKAVSGGKKVFIISANNFLVEAQNTLLKMFEEPIENTIFFLIVPNTAIILPTLLSRFYLIRTKEGIDLREAEKFIKMSLNDRILFIKEFLTENDEENLQEDGVRSKSLKFLNVLETVLHQRLFTDRALDSQIESKALSETDYFYQILKVREYLSEPGSSTKSLMESIALSIPKL